MKTNRHRTTSPPGVALVITILMVALLALLIVGFLGIASSHRQQAEHDLGGRQADAVVQMADLLTRKDLLLEMKSSSTTMDMQPDGSRLFDVTDAKGMVSARVLRSSRVSGNAGFANLWKQSAYGLAFDGKSGSRRASEVSTASANAEGKSIAPLRWMAPQFISPTEQLSADDVPHWIYLARDGSTPNVFSPQLKTKRGSDGEAEPRYVIGRYAYQIYQTAGLLDVNIAGYGASANLADVSTKGSLLWADLSVLPGATPTLQSMADWRNGSSWAQAQRQWVEALGQRSGWLSMEMAQGRYAQRWLSRGDLLRYQKKNPQIVPSSLLPFLTHQSRELNQPSYAPTKNAPSAAFAYLGKKNDPLAINRRVLGVRASAAFSRFDDEQEGAQTAVIGEPLIARRFPLSWLDWFAQSNLDEKKIATHFGLKRDADGYRWSYEELNSSEKIKTLQEVADEGKREPNFFELLQAGMLSGSIGSGGLSSKTFFNSPDLDGNTAAQILRIGACIIDQYDRDDNPTVISAVASTDIFGVSSRVDLAGVENLPYIDIIGQQHIRRSDLPGFPAFPFVSCYYQIQLWNPHRQAATMQNGNFRIIGEGEPYVRIGWWPKGWQTQPVFWEEGSGFVANANNCFLSFDVPMQNATFPRLDKPVQLLGKHLTGWSPDNVLPAGSASPKFAGIYLGRVKCGEDNPNVVSSYPNCGEIQGHLKFDRPMTLKLQKKINGAWVTYQTIPVIEEHHGNVPWPATVDSSAYNGTPNLRITYARADPRCLRFGMSSAGSGTSERVNGKTVDPLTNQVEVWDNKAATGDGLSGVKGNQAQLAFNDGTGWSYLHRDGLRRTADASRALPGTIGSPYGFGDGRPHILNRPFRSVAEFGYAFRDEPWKTLDFSKDNSADLGLLDLFSLTESSERLGVINPNVASVEALTAIFSSTEIDPVTNTKISRTTAKALATAIRNSLATNPIRHPGEIIERINTVGASLGKKQVELEALARAFADVCSTRYQAYTIDMIAQSGMLLPAANKLDDFVIHGEKRVWIHLVLDRFTGETISRQTEQIFE
jgi:hypothetical protein